MSPQTEMYATKSDEKHTGSALVVMIRFAAKWRKSEHSKENQNYIADKV